MRFFKAIQRLSEGNDLLIDEASRFMNKIFTAGESIQEMEALKKYQEETKKWENFCQIKGIHLTFLKVNYQYHIIVFLT